MDVVFKYTNFGVVSITHGDYFLQTKNYKSGHIVDHCCCDYNRHKNAIVLFPEGIISDKSMFTICFTLIIVTNAQFYDLLNVNF